MQCVVITCAKWAEVATAEESEESTNCMANPLGAGKGKATSERVLFAQKL